MLPDTSDSPANAEAFESVALPHLAAVARVARALTRDESDADDLVQETYLRALKHWHTFVPGSDCKRWLATICRNAFFAEQERAKRVTAVEDEELDSLSAINPHRAARAADLEDLFDRFDLGPTIRAELDRLPPSFRDVVVLFDVEGFRYEEIAELLMIPIGTVRSRLYRARRLLQETLLAHAIDRGLAPDSLPPSVPIQDQP